MSAIIVTHMNPGISAQRSFMISSGKILEDEHSSVEVSPFWMNAALCLILLAAISSEHCHSTEFVCDK